MEDTRLVFSNIMEKLLKQAQKNKNVLEYKEVNDAFKNIELTPEKFEWILDRQSEIPSLAKFIQFMWRKILRRLSSLLMSTKKIPTK